MRKILGLVAIAFGFMACENDVKFNDPGIRAEMTIDAVTDTLLLKQLPLNDLLQYNRFTEFKPQDFKALVANGKDLVIEAKTDSTKLVINVSGYEHGGRYEFNANEGVKASYYIIGDDDQEIGFYNTETTDAVKERPGYVLFDTAAKQIPNAISGTFVINMGAVHLPEDEKDSKGKVTKSYVKRKAFQKGVFFRIPLAPAK